MRRGFKNKIALITGGGSGIGRACAVAFVKKGAKVVVADLNRRMGEETVNLIKGIGGDAIFLKVDVSNSAEVEKMIDKSVGAYGRLDYAFNNAGIPGITSLLTAEYPESAWSKVIKINLTGVWLCMKYEIPEMLKNNGGAIVNMSSLGGLVGSRLGAAYTASKHGVVGLTKIAAIEYAKKNIRINAVCPGAVKTPMLENFLDENPLRKSRMIDAHPIGRFGEPEEVAEAVIWLCSDSASFVTGHIMVVDGGRVAE